jgi:hypothetical protein
MVVSLTRLFGDKGRIFLNGSIYGEDPTEWHSTAK